MSITFQSAYLQLTATGAKFTVDALFDLVDRVSGEVRGAAKDATYLLFSGVMPDGTRTSSIAAEIAAKAHQPVYDIGFSEIGKLLDSREFDDALKRALANELGVEYDAASDSQKAAIEIKRLLLKDGTDISGNRVSSTSMWDIGSDKFVEEANGSFRIISPGKMGDTSVLVQSELPALLDNNKVTLIDGMPREDLVALRNSHGIEAVKKVITNNSLTQVVYTGLSSSSFDEYLATTPERISAAAGDLQKQQVLRDYLSTLNKDDRRYLTSGGELINDLGRAGSKVGKGLLKILGPVGILVGLGLATSEASAAEAAGRHDEAKEIMVRWAVDASGSEVAQIAAGAIAAIGAAVLVAAGTIPASVAAALVLGISLLGGFFGGDGAVELYELTKDKDEDKRADIINKLDNLLFGVTSTITTPLPADLNGNKLTIDASLTRDELIGQARNSIAWRYALRELNSFVITDIDYTAHNADGSLNLSDAASGSGMTEAYLADRADMLGWKLRWDRPQARDDDDSPRMAHKSYDDDWDTNAVTGNWDYVDLSKRLPGGAPLTLAIDGVGLSLSDHQIVFGSKNNDSIVGAGDSDRLYGMAGDDVITAKDGADYAEGGAGNDRLDGGEGADTLLGGDGLDTLAGGAGSDLLQGGKGLDKYIFDGKFGHDTIDDLDGDGEIWINGAKFNGGTWVGDGVYKDSATGWSYARVAGDLLISKTGESGQITVRHWGESASVGITLAGSAPRAPPPSLIADAIVDTQGCNKYVLQGVGEVSVIAQGSGELALNFGEGQSLETLRSRCDSRVMAANDACHGSARHACLARLDQMPKCA